MTIKKNILYFINILIFLCFVSYIGSFIISAFFASQEINLILKVILIALIAIIIGACYIIGSAAHEWDVVQDFYAEGKHIRVWEIVCVVCMMALSAAIPFIFLKAEIGTFHIVSVVFALLIIPIVYFAGRASQDLITGFLAAAFCIAIPAGAFLNGEGFSFSEHGGFLASCRYNFENIGDGVVINILSRLETIAEFQSSFPKLIMCIFFFFSIWSGLFLFVSKKNGGFLLTVYFNLVVILQMLFDFSGYFYLIIYPAAALTAAMGISFFVHKWIFDEEIEDEEGYDEATESSFENFSIVKEEDAEEELKRTGASEKTEKAAEEIKETAEEKQPEEKEEEQFAHEVIYVPDEDTVEVELPETDLEIPKIEASESDTEETEIVEFKEEGQDSSKPEILEAEAGEAEFSGLEFSEEELQETETEEPEIVEFWAEEPSEDTEAAEMQELEIVESDSARTEPEIVEFETEEREPQPAEMEAEEPAAAESDLEKTEPEEELPETESDKPDELDLEEAIARIMGDTIIQETPVWEEDKEMNENESMLLDREEEFLFSSEQQDEDERAFFDELANSAKETEQLKEQVLQAEEELTELTEKYQKQKGQLKDLIQLLEQAKERQKMEGQEIVDTRKKIVRLESELQSLNKDVAEKNKKLSDSEMQVNKYRMEAEEKQAEAEKYREQAERSRRKAEQLEAETEKALEDTKREAARYLEEAEKYRQTAEESRLEAERLKEEAEEAKKQVEAAKAENNRYKEEAERLRTQLASQEESFRMENTVLQGKIDDLQEQLQISLKNASKEEIERLKEEKQTLQNNYETERKELLKEKELLEKKYQEEVQKRKELLRRAKEEINRIRTQAPKKTLR